MTIDKFKEIFSQFDTKEQISVLLDLILTSQVIRERIQDSLYLDDSLPHGTLLSYKEKDDSIDPWIVCVLERRGPYKYYCRYICTKNYLRKDEIDQRQVFEEVTQVTKWYSDHTGEIDISNAEEAKVIEPIVNLFDLPAYFKNGKRKKKNEVGWSFADIDMISTNPLWERSKRVKFQLADHITE